MNFKERKLAITDIETTGDLPGIHEIIEIGLVVCDPNTFEILDTLNIKIKPINLETAVPIALERNGYNEKDWEGAGTLEEAMKVYSEKTADCIFYGYNVSFDWGFMQKAFIDTKVQNKMDYHRFDVMSMAYFELKDKMERVSLNVTSTTLGIPEEVSPHNALNGAMQAYLVLKKLMQK